MVRIYFKSKLSREKFFKDVLKYLKLNNWKELRKKFNIPREGETQVDYGTNQGSFILNTFDYKQEVVPLHGNCCK